MANCKNNPRRKKKFIDACVQGALARRIIVHWIVFLGVGSFVAFVLQVLANPFRPLSAHAQEMWWSHGPFMLVMAFLLPVFVVDTIKLSHRFAGPVYSLRRALRGIAQGEKPRRLKFRQHDFWHGLAEDYNAMLVKLNLVEEKPADESKELVGSESK
jgi:hypothetical protein